MLGEIRNNVNRLSDELLLNKAEPNRDIVSEVMSLDASIFPEISSEDLSKFIFVLGQYLVMLQYNTNMKLVEYISISRSLEHKINLFKFTFDIPKSLKITTEKQIKSWAIENDEDVNQLYYDSIKAEAEKTILDGMVNSVEALLNALKKEKSSRNPYYENDR